VLRILFATDFHGAEVCFRKLFNLAPRAKADVIVIGGDLCGKGLVPLVERNGSYSGEFLGTPFDVPSGEQSEEIEKRIRFNGFYPYRCTPEEVERLRTDPEHLQAVMDGELVATVERWMTLADEKLADTDAICVSIPGNDDDVVIDDALNAAMRVRNCDGRLLDFGEFQIVGFGASNPTPWNSPREFPEEEIGRRLQETVDGLDPDRPLLANIHVPPYRSTLDDAPMVDEQLRPVIKGGNPVAGPVGSHAVRSFIERYQPMVSLHGHIHESRSATRIGRTLAVNPGSDYSSGTLQAVIVSIDLRKHKVKGHQFISG
jgi:Icc-related predicted phosphoesterase